jgi:DNA-binding response OmpR family regulator
MTTVLVVEDDFDTLFPLSELLRLRGYATISASEAGPALELARKRRPDLIITDIALPGASGLQLIGKVRADDALRKTPIIVISGCSPTVLLEAARAGADCCLEKPINIDNLWTAIGGALADHRDPAADRRAEAQDEPDRAIAIEIDRLVENLRGSSSGEERDIYLKRLKERILQLQSRKGSRA